ncbi:MAG TPA: DUF1957 domain-containing protein [Thermotogota bacterium]|nr:DUF1957 domain-containing protein [Thermotogota bacterium]HRW92834.1 DUF1957 domain-containing protein [Thermotogota bacterium]
MEKGFVSLVLHAHLPYVRHPDFEEFMEERWLFEAITETYIPILRAFQDLERDNVPFKITMSITPPLMEMLDSNDLQDKYVRHMQKLIELAEKEVERTRTEHPRKHKMAKYYHQDFQDILHIFETENNRSLVKAFGHFQEKGNLEIITCNATHGFLPLMNRFPQAVRAQVTTGAKTYEKHLGVAPKGMWLAECGYTAGLDKYLAEENIRYFFVDSHGIWFAENPPRYGVYRPLLTENGVFVFGRDPESSEQVWSAEIGYPGDFRYREFYRDVGFDRELEYITPYIDRSGVRVNTGMKYHRVTGKNIDLGKKDFYDIDEARQAAKEHARDFALKKQAQLEGLHRAFDGVVPIVVAPFDAELFGHWWFEGPMFIENFFRELHTLDTVAPITPPEFIEQHVQSVQIATPADSTWGANGYNEVWINGSNDWVYPHLDELIVRMTELVHRHGNQNDAKKDRLLKQAMRELLLAQSSDWAFIMTTGTTVEYASNRTRQHVDRFLKIARWLDKGNMDEKTLASWEWLDKIFEDPDYNLYLKSS